MKKTLLLAFSLVALCATAQTPVIDNTFNTAETGIYKQNIGEHCALLSDGKILTLYRETENSNYKVIRLNADGSIDGAFTPIPVGSGNLTDDIFVNANNDFIVRVYMPQPTGAVLLYFNADGTPKAGFTSPLFKKISVDGNLGEVRTITFQPDGKLMVGGIFTTVGVYGQAYAVRLNTDGSVDTTFTGVVGNTVNSIIRLSDGKYLIGGDFLTVGGTTRKRIARLNENGTLDTAFSTPANQYLNDEVYKLTIQPNGKILADSDYYNASTFQTPSKLICRLNADGTRDTTFSYYYSSSSDQYMAYDYLLQSDGKIVVYANDKIFRISATGSVDSSFLVGNLDHMNALVPATALYSVSGGKIMVNSKYRNAAGQTRMGIHRLNANGTLDTAFNPSAGPNLRYIDFNGASTRCYTMGLPDGKMLLHGSFTSYNDVGVKGLVRLNPDGDLDTSFSLAANINNISGYTTKIRRASDGKFLIGGSNDVVVGTQYLKMIRISANGAYDGSFNFAVSSGNISDFELQNDKIIATGVSSTFITPESLHKLVRFNTNGSIDNSFHSELFYDLQDFEIQPDGKILLFGMHLSADGEQVYRLNANGFIDNTFAMTTYNVKNFKLQPDGKILYTRANDWDNANNTLRRVNADGTVDDTFTPFDVSNSWSGAGSIDPAEFYFTSGNKIIYRYGYAPYYTLLDWDGSFVMHFATLPDAADSDTRSAMQGCDKLIVTSCFDTMDGQTKNSIVRYNLAGAGNLSPNMPTGATSQNFSNGQTLANLILTGQNLTWYAQQSPCYQSYTDRNANDTALPLSTLLVDGTTYYATQTVNGVESMVRFPVTVHLVMGIGDAMAENGLIAYPNPVSGLLRIDMKSTIEKLEVYNMLGQKVSVKTAVEGNSGTADFSGLPSGSYLIRVSSEGTSKTIKILKP